MSFQRTAAFTAANVAWATYGGAKWAVEGPSGAWPLVAVAVLGTVMNTRVLKDIIKSRRAERRAADLATNASDDPK